MNSDSVSHGQKTYQQVASFEKPGDFVVRTGPPGSNTPGFTLSGLDGTVVFENGADPKDPEFWRTVYSIPNLTRSGLRGVLALVERVYRYNTPAPSEKAAP